MIRLNFSLKPDSSHNTDILNYNSSIVLPGRAILEELILCIALVAGAIFSSILPVELGEIVGGGSVINGADPV